MTTRDENGHLELGGRREFDVIRAMLGVWGPHAHGIGDDAAVLTVPEGQRLIASTDASFEGVHFRREWLRPREIGARAAAAALSDLAAMAATPLGLLLALALPQSWLPEIEEVAHGVGEMASRTRCPIVGGNLARADVLSLTLTVLGSAVNPLARAGARAGDIVYVTGLLGGFTTFSAFSVESLILLQRGELLLALGHTLAHVVGALTCAAVGFRVAQTVLMR